MITKSDSTKIPLLPSEKKSDIIKESIGVENTSKVDKIINLKSTFSSKRENEVNKQDNIKVSISSKTSQFDTKNISTQITDELNSKEIILTEEKLEEIKESIISSLISELKISRRTVNLLTDDQILILNKMGKFIGDMYYHASDLQ